MNVTRQEGHGQAREKGVLERPQQPIQSLTQCSRISFRGVPGGPFQKSMPSLEYTHVHVHVHVHVGCVGLCVHLYCLLPTAISVRSVLLEPYS